LGINGHDPSVIPDKPDDTHVGILLEPCTLVAQPQAPSSVPLLSAHKCQSANVPRRNEGLLRDKLGHAAKRLAAAAFIRWGLN
jgi:hypothetical protein